MKNLYLLDKGQQRLDIYYRLKGSASNRSSLNCQLPGGLIIRSFSL
ncbi:unnamed protein product [Protopolystoma xenopodis]|uniref:Uncharacterized protein n=1 Tax=Protopolystoma xenopodis TaxID=117903 RepID=A0A3S5A860_9PLAT|nr:unnamed protein product [Protopolystoma xenopodis]